VHVNCDQLSIIPSVETETWLFLQFFTGNDYYSKKIHHNHVNAELDICDKKQMVAS